MNWVLSTCRSVVVNSATRRMSSKYSYEEAVRKLNSLQSNKATLDQIKYHMKVGKKNENLEEMESYLLRTGVTLEQLDRLSVIHVAGTKGKGSTSAMCESILRQHGLRTGFYSSPHLCAVRERIRLGGRVLAREPFAEHFHRVYDMLHGSQAFEGDMPKYFAFLTVLAFHVFLREAVDVAVVEVGIGGAVDSTNVIRKVPVVGITALGLDHTTILGSTLQEIARAKAGIMKPGCRAFTVPQPPAAMAELVAAAAETPCPLTVVPDYVTYNLPSEGILQVDLPAFQSNASLAIQLAHAWLKDVKRNALKNKAVKKIGGKNLTEIDAVITGVGKDEELHFDHFGVPIETVIGLKECRWPGRYQKIEGGYASFYLDGAHTPESMEICARWFEDNARNQNKVLIFSATGDRDVEVLLAPLTNLNFKAVFFVIPTAYKDLKKQNDNYSKVEHTELIGRCSSNADVWKSNNSSTSDIFVMESVSEALISIKRSYNSVDKSSVLITGSLHLVGAALSVIDPNLSRD